MWYSHIPVRTNLHHFKSLPLVPMGRGKCQFQMQENGVEFEKKYSERAILFPQTITDTILINEQKQLIQRHNLQKKKIRYLLRVIYRQQCFVMHTTVIKL